MAADGLRLLLDCCTLVLTPLAGAAVWFDHPFQDILVVLAAGCIAVVTAGALRRFWPCRDNT